MARLLITKGSSPGRALPLAEHRLVMIGRDDQCTFQLLDDQVSRRHLQIRFEASEGNHYASDCRSANGVFVNGNRIVDDVQLTDGDEIVVGDTTFVYHLEEDEDVDAAMDAYRKKDEWKRGTSF